MGDTVAEAVKAITDKDKEITQLQSSLAELQARWEAALQSASEKAAMDGDAANAQQHQVWTRFCISCCSSYLQIWDQNASCDGTAAFLVLYRAATSDPALAGLEQIRLELTLRSFRLSKRHSWLTRAW